MSLITKPHDKFFKETLSDLETTKDFMKNYLPKDILEIIIQDVYETVKNISLERSGDIMTIAEQLIKEGMEKGLEKGIEQGMEKGIIEGKRKTAKNFLKLGFPVKQVAEAAELSLEEVMQLKREIEN